MRSSAGSDRGVRRTATATTRDGGQAVVELALSLPVVLLLLLGVVQVAVVVRGELVTHHAARDAARAAAVSAAPREAAARAVARYEIDGAGVSVAVSPDVVRVEVRSRTRTDVPLVGALVGDVEHRATAVMPREPP